MQGNAVSQSTADTARTPKIYWKRLSALCTTCLHERRGIFFCMNHHHGRFLSHGIVDFFSAAVVSYAENATYLVLQAALNKL